MKQKNKGWKGESYRHSTSRRGVLTAHGFIENPELYENWKKSRKELSVLSKNMDAVKFYIKDIEGQKVVCFDLEDFWYFQTLPREETQDMKSTEELLQHFIKWQGSDIQIKPIIKPISYYPDEYHEVKENEVVGYTIISTKGDFLQDKAYNLAKFLTGYVEYIEQQEKRYDQLSYGYKNYKKYLIGDDSNINDDKNRPIRYHNLNHLMYEIKPVDYA